MFNDLLKSRIKIKDIEKDLGVCSIEKKVEDLLKTYFEEKYKEKKRFLDYFNKLQSFAFMSNTNINYLSLFNKDYSLFFSNFIFFVKSNGFTSNLESQKTIIIATIFLVEKLNINFNQNINLTIKPKISLRNLNKENLKYLNGWKYGHPSLKSNSLLNLYKYSSIFGISEANKIEEIINSIQQYRVETLILNDFFDYLSENKLSIFKSMNKDILQDFMKKYFKSIIDNKKCVNSAKREWNILIRSLKGYFGLDNELKLSLTRKHKDPNQMNLKIVDGLLVKNKLITHIPLEIKDDKALFIIKDKINQDINVIKDWSILNLKKFDDLKDDNKILTKKELYSIFVLLIMENPSITESFLNSLKYSNSYIKIDDKFFLIGKKPRRGDQLAEQKIQLTLLSVNIIDQYLTWTKNYEKNEDSLFMYKSKERIKYMSKIKDKSLYTQTQQRSFKKYLKELLFPNDYIENIVNNSYLSKIRSTVAIKIYFETESTTKMSQALGHNTYNAKLLSHYLPQSILDFYQQRWIRIFQKGLICEALKNSNFILNASNFENMNQLDLFLKNHMLKNLPDNLNNLFEYDKDNKEFDSFFISVNKDNLMALFSLKKAVNESNNKDLISEKAFFWLSFCDHLEKEILTNREYNEFREILIKAKEESNSINFNKVIYG